MPELPDVEQFRVYVESTSLHKTITDVEVLHPRILDGIDGDALMARLKGRAFTGTRRRGKYLFLTINRAENESSPKWPALVLHFGMTGYPLYEKANNELPKHARFTITFENGYRLNYVLQRLLGRVRFTDNIDFFIEKRNIGPDVLSYDYEMFETLFKNKKGRCSLPGPAEAAFRYDEKGNQQGNRTTGRH